MAEVASIYIKRGSGMTTSAAALATGLIASGLKVCYVVPLRKDIGLVPHNIPRDIIKHAEHIGWLRRGCPDVYVVDDAIRCDEVLSLHREGSLLNLSQNRLSHHDDSFTRIYLFQHTI